VNPKKQCKAITTKQGALIGGELVITLEKKKMLKDLKKQKEQGINGF